jgi:hypothetical protein
VAHLIPAVHWGGNSVLMHSPLSLESPCCWQGWSQPLNCSIQVNAFEKVVQVSSAVTQVPSTLPEPGMHILTKLSKNSRIQVFWLAM